MKLKIKEGSSIQPYGGNTMAFTSESDLTQDVLEHLKESYPDDIEDLEAEQLPIIPIVPVEPELENKEVKTEDVKKLNK